ncbi:YggT family protein [Sporosalibacterium faouarense]|uniref:YggT family protein n=1 Tax=Sporosalibacterium faouarense TaxID=516123 RepID=UPI00141C0A7B|nr:YggT family protein [Sporosalibacterium faouarense]MTI47756.1 YggT family protein [Bacillota bacterium]
MWVLYESINRFVYLIQILILVRIALSFIIRDMSNPLFRVIYQITEPILAPFRNLIARLGINTGMFDFSPILAMFAVQIIAGIITNLLRLM